MDAAPLPAPPSLWQRLRAHPLIQIGPGIITGVADDDPSGIGTYSQAGAQFGFDMLWTMPFCLPFMGAIQSMCAEIGRVTGSGLAANIKQIFPASILRFLVLILLAANTLNIAADVAAMGEAAHAVTGLNRHVMTAGFVTLMLGLQIGIPYHRYVRILKFLTLSLLAYPAVLFATRVPWGQVALHSLIPHFTFSGGTAAMVVGIFGTTISPYLFFWQASEEVEDMNCPPGPSAHRSAGSSARRIAPHQMGYLGRHVGLQPCRLYHHPCHRHYAAPGRHHGYR